MKVKAAKVHEYSEFESLLKDALKVDDEGKDIGSLTERLGEVGIHRLHRGYYDGGFAQHPVIGEHLQEHPDGALAQLLLALVKEKSATDGYSTETLKKMYGLGEGE